ncbi:protein NLRC3-like [Ostrinia furnacalis]|uniref:protein NLRC3-like n=1 Tax=Ostrinia furnacalis TaxID=93504 RepID=UPI001038A858|nr:protein NLRC3-like [Ostrinia furnacalis]
MSDSESSEEEVVEEILAPPEEISSGEDPPMSEWSSLIIELPEENKKRALMADGLYSPGSGELCTKYVAMSDSDIAIHPYYNYPAVLDPGIMDALTIPEKPVIYGDDGQDLYLALCKDMNTCPVGMFHRSLLTNEINLSFYGVNPNGVRPMAMALQYNKTVRRFDLTDNFLNDDSCFHLAQMLTVNSTIKELILSGCRIGASGILRLGSTLSVNRSLVTLNLAGNCLGEDGGVYFAKQIGDGAGVPRVSLSKNELGRMTAFALAEALEYRNKLTHLDLSWNNFFHAPSVVKMLDQLSYSKVLQELNLAWNSMEGERVAGMLKEIFLIPALKVLNISHNRFQGEALALLLGNLIKAKKLVTLDMSFNPFSTDDAYHALEKMLKPRVKLDNLYLDGITVEKKFLTLLERVLKMKSRKNFTIKHGRVLHNWTVQGPDPRKLIMERMDYLGKRDRKRRMDVALFFLRIAKEYPKPIPIKALIDVKDYENVPLDDDLINELGAIFPGPKTAKYKTINIQTVCEYINRIWPDRKLPPTPPPEPEPEPEPPPPPPLPKGKGKGKK